jgi:hypothetical protein
VGDWRNGSASDSSPEGDRRLIEQRKPDTVADKVARDKPTHIMLVMCAEPQLLLLIICIVEIAAHRGH